MLIRAKNFICTHWVKILLVVMLLTFAIFFLTGCRKDTVDTSAVEL